jgi:hypothetical protein
MGILYQLSFPNGKSYIGITAKPLEIRIRGSLKSSNTQATR